ncbi:metallophosphoesterase [Chitinophaga pinensis]|uniref:Metallophosphoesterase n=1 Tax=Chitinophaga pinensis (strain ATCC 43595 / DSM 2588 / LMG 13176 / NBRC 15968 / NCIMB 11800 / UQM 2034) TaxID=485918 RepID=A0A979G2M9_CHIPD|nr:metallophosphoesterase [Chitinophaga pinensis]ACU59528.1 metallophosphoesterase [Chitinophaga pinensis DSM 2588]
MRTGWNSIVLIFILLLLDLYVFMAIRAIFSHSSKRVRNIATGTYWAVSALVLITIALLPYLNWQDWPANTRSYILTVLFGIVFAKVLAAVFMLLDDLRRGVQWIISYFTRRSQRTASLPGGISRSRFFSQVALLLGGGMFATLMYGLSNKYNYRVHKLKLSFKNLPPAFKGLRIVQISDIHSGSLTDKEAVIKGVEMINAQKGDIILFTGDLVNDRASEMDNLMDVFRQVKAPMGVYSTLGNHDYGDYYAWPDKDANGYSALRTQNLEQLKQVHADMGWRLLMNEHVTLERGGQEIALLGIENWSAMSRFPKYGDMKKAYAGASHQPFKILMSHDPTHWDAQVRTEYPDIDLMLAGHTHGMQFGVEIPGFKWSPARFIYKEWAGLYKEGNQRLYVNRGFGFLGYPGRVGILPEITVIELA